jgi:hypothetical protein
MNSLGKIIPFPRMALRSMGDSLQHGDHRRLEIFASYFQ